MKTSREKQRLEAFINEIEKDGRYAVAKEVKFHPIRKWRFDWALVRSKKQIAIEYDGGVFTGGGHVRGMIFSSNCEKLNTAALMGWTVLRFTAPMIRAGMHETMIKEALK